MRRPNSDFLRKVLTAFKALIKQRQLELVRFEPSNSFDNALVEFRSPELALRVIRERSQHSVDVDSIHGTPPVAGGRIGGDL